MPTDNSHTAAAAASPPRLCSRWSDASGFTLIEVLVAMVLVAVVCGGVAMATFSSARTANASTANDREMAASKRIFDYLRNNRAWMRTCTTANCNLSGAFAAGDLQRLLADRSLGATCASSTAQFAFVLQAAWATPVDSNMDGKGAADTDGITPDYFVLHVGTLPPTACDATRLGISPTAPAVYESAVDQRGEIPTGNLVVEVCAIRNQVDFRMNVGGCRAPFMQSKEHGCPPLNPSATNNTVYSQCDEAIAAKFLQDPPAGPVTPSLYSRFERSNASFTISGPSGTFSSSSASHPETGLYKFDDLKSGTYVITVNGVAAGQKFWVVKSGPASVPGSNTKLQVNVQPDSTNSAIVTTRPPDVDTFGIHFTREVGFYHAKKVFMAKGWSEIKHPTKIFQGDTAAFLQWFADQQMGGSFVTIVPMRSWQAGNCIYGQYEVSTRAGHTVVVTNPGPPITTTNVWVDDPPIITHPIDWACTWYDTKVGLDYWKGVSDGTQIWNGAAVDATYQTMPAPMSRDAFDAPYSAGGDNFNKGDVKVDYLTVKNATGQNLSTAAATEYFDPMSTGLNTGVYVKNGTTQVYNTKTGYSQTAHTNTALIGLPAGLTAKTGKKAGIWVHPDGSIITSAIGSAVAQQSYPQGKVFTVEGKGECYWNANQQLGPCNRCNPYIVDPGANLNGWFHECYVLVAEHSCQKVYATSSAWDGTSFFDTQTKCQDDDSIGVCNSVPQRGTATAIAPNCYRPPCLNGGACPPPPRGIPGKHYVNHTRPGYTESFDTTIAGVM